MKRYILLVLIVVFAPQINFAQAYYSFRGKIKIKNKTELRRIDKAVRTVHLNATDKATRDVKFSEKGVEYTAKIERPTAAAGEDVMAKDTNIIVVKATGGWANIYADKDDQSIVHVNYWLNPRHYVLKGVTVKDVSRTWTDPDHDVLTDDPKATAKPLDKFTAYDLWKVDADRKKISEIQREDWYVNSPRIVTVYKADKVTPDYYLVDRYCSDCDYQINFNNRDYKWYPSYSFDLGALTIPFKIRPQYYSNRIKQTIATDVGADFNLGIFGGASFGRVRYRYEKDGLKTLPEVKFTIGAFFNIGKQDLDTLSTSAGEKPYLKDEKHSIIYTSYGLGLMLSVANIKAGAFFGFDNAVGSERKNWNFNGKPWIGFGLGYNLAGLWGSK